jgi:hypothetical protein
MSSRASAHVGGRTGDARTDSQPLTVTASRRAGAATTGLPGRRGREADAATTGPDHDEHARSITEAGQDTDELARWAARWAERVPRWSKAKRQRIAGMLGLRLDTAEEDTPPS